MRRAIRYAVFATPLAFVAVIIWLIARTPLPGEPSPAALAAAYQQAIAAGDVDQVTRLVASPPEDPEAVSPLMRPAGCPTAVTVTAAEDRLLLRTNGTECAWVPIAERDGRWLIDPWAQPVH